MESPDLKEPRLRSNIYHEYNIYKMRRGFERIPDISHLEYFFINESQRSFENGKLFSESVTSINKSCHNETSILHFAYPCTTLSDEGMTLYE